MARGPTKAGRRGFLKRAAAALTGTVLGASRHAHARPQRGALLRVSLDTAPNHLRNIGVRSFAARVEAALPGRFRFQFYESGQLYGDRDTTKALLWGDLEFAVPTILQLARLEPLANITSLPMFYGLAEQTLRRIQDELVMPELARRLESRFAVKALLPALDLGYTQVFTTDRPLRSSRDLQSLKIRVPGGLPNLRRLRLQGAYPVSIPWSDAPLSLSQGNIDGVTTTYETAQSAALWDVGVQHALEDRAMFVQYMPMLRRTFWDRLDDATRQVLDDCWRQELRQARAFAAARQARARQVMIEHGVRITVPDVATLKVERERLLESQDSMVDELGMPSDVVARVAAAATGAAP